VSQGAPSSHNRALAGFVPEDVQRGLESAVWLSPALPAYRTAMAFAVAVASKTSIAGHTGQVAPSTAWFGSPSLANAPRLFIIASDKSRRPGPNNDVGCSKRDGSERQRLSRPPRAARHPRPPFRRQGPPVGDLGSNHRIHDQTSRIHRVGAARRPS